jgi:LPS sulfotransferase NodH
MDDLLTGRSIMLRLALLALLAVSAVLPAASVYALDNVNPYICPTAFNGSGTDCFFEAVPHTYAMCHLVKSIEIMEFGLAGAQQGVNGAKTEGCIEKNKRLIARPYQAALREAGRDKRKVQGLQELYATWTRSLAELTPGLDEIDAGYKQRVTHPYGAFEKQIQALREPTPVAAAKPATKPATKKKSASQ